MELVHGTHKTSKFAPQDFISNMPDDVVTNILNRLPLQYALRAGILSRHWRSKWTMLSELVFDWDFFYYLAKRESRRNFARIIYRLLLHIEGAITKFEIYLNDDSCGIEQCILFLSKKGVKEFSVSNITWARLKLPTHIFSCLDLKHLELQNYIFNTPACFHGFPNLLSLVLWDVEFESEAFVRFFTKCPILEILTLGYLNGLDKVKVVDFAKLKNLKILTLLINNLDDTEITSFNRIFEFVGFLPKLQELHLNFDDCKPFTEEDDVRNRSSSIFSCLKRLKLSNIDLGSGIVLSFAFEIIKSSPNLQSLEITARWLCSEGVKSPHAIVPEGDYNAMGFLQLRSVVLEASENEVCLIKYLLACSPFLEKIVIDASKLHSNKKMEFFAKLLKLNRASPVAEIILC